MPGAFPGRVASFLPARSLEVAGVDVAGDARHGASSPGFDFFRGRLDELPSPTGPRPVGLLVVDQRHASGAFSALLSAG